MQVGLEDRLRAGQVKVDYTHPCDHHGAQSCIEIPLEAVLSLVE
jgi:hypothetical protein